MATIGTLIARITGDTSGLARAEREAKSRLRSIDASLRSTEQASKAVWKAMGTLASTVAGTLLARQFVQAASSAEQLRLQLNVLTKDGTKAFKELNDWAAKMPVNTEQTIEIFKKLQAYGLKPTTEMMETLVDASMALTGTTQGFEQLARALGQMQALGRVSAEELNQLADAGYNAREVLKKTFQLTAKDMQDFGKAFEERGISVRQVIDVLLKDMEAKFGGISKSMETSWVGLMNRLEHQWWTFRDAVMESGPFQAMKTSLDVFIRYLESKRGQMDLTKWAEATGRAIVDAFRFAAKGVNLFLQALNYARAGFAQFMKWWATKQLEAIDTTLSRLQNPGWMDKAMAGLFKVVGMGEEYNKVQQQEIKRLKEQRQGYEALRKAADEYYSDSLKNVTDMEKQYEELNKWFSDLRQSHQDAAASAQAGAQAAKTEVQAQQQLLQVRQAQAAHLKNALEVTYDQLQTTLELKLQLAELNKDTDLQRQLQKEILELELRRKLALGDYTEEQKRLLQEVYAKQIEQQDQIIEQVEQKLPEAWQHAFDRITDFLADWIYRGKIELSSFFDWIKQAFAQLAATQIVGVVTAPMFGMNAAAVGTGGMGAGGGVNLLGTAAGVGNLFSSGGLSGVANTMMALPTNLSSQLARSFNNLGWDAASDFMVGANEFFVANPVLSGALTAGVGGLLTGLFTGNWTSAIGSAVGGASGFALGSTLGSWGGPIGAVVGGIAGSLLSGLFGGDKPDHSWFKLYTQALESPMAYAQSPFGTISIPGRGPGNDLGYGSEASRQFAQHVVDTIAAYDAQIAQVLDAGAQEAFASGIPDVIMTQSWRTDSEDQAKNAVLQLMKDYYGSAFGSINSMLEDLINSATLDNFDQYIAKAAQIAALSGKIPGFWEQLAQIMDESATSAEEAVAVIQGRFDAVSQLVAQGFNAAAITGGSLEDFQGQIMSGVRNALASGLTSAALNSMIEQISGELIGTFPELIDRITSGQGTLDDYTQLLGAIEDRVNQLTPEFDTLRRQLEALGVVSSEATSSVSEVADSVSEVAETITNETLAYYNALLDGGDLLDAKLAQIAARYDWLGGGYMSSTGEYDWARIMQAISGVTAEDIVDIANSLDDLSFEGVVNDILTVKQAFTELTQSMIDSQEKLASEWAGVADDISSALFNLTYSNANPASITNQLSSLQQSILGMDYSTPEQAREYVSALEEYLQLAQSAYQRPSIQYQEAYDFVTQHLEAAQDLAISKQDEALAIAREQRELLEDIAQNTSNLSTVTIYAADGQSSEDIVNQVIAVLQSDVGRVIIQNTAGGR